MNELALLPIAFLTSSVAGVMGMGGGILLIALMPGFVPPGAIIPLHAATQLASNSSRAIFGWRHIDLRILPAFALGALLGAWLGSEIYQSLNLHWLPAIIGVLILYLAWLPPPRVGGGGHWALVALGFYQTGLGMIAGATGPLGAAVLLRRNRDRDWLVVNTGAYMTLAHAMRVAAFFVMGFSFAAWWELLLGMIIASIAGSWLGTKLRAGVGQVQFQRWFKWLVTVLAIRMIVLPFLS